MGFNEFWLNLNGKKQQVGDVKHGVRKNQVDQKFHNLFDAYDANQDGTLEKEELTGIFKGLSKFAGADKVLDAKENAQVKSVFSQQVNIQDADFQGFVKSISDASAEIKSTRTTPTADGGKEVVTTYKDGTTETISYYPNGEYKFKKIDQNVTVTRSLDSYTIGNDMNTKYTAKQLESKIKKAYNELAAKNAEINTIEGKNLSIIPYYADFKQAYFKKYRIKQGTESKNIDRHEFELSERAKRDKAVRDSVITHYVETHQAVKEVLDSMGLLDDAGALINAGAGEVWNLIKNKWNGTNEEYQNFFELKEKFEPSYEKSLQMQKEQEIAQQHQEDYFRGEIGDIDIEKSIQFQKKVEQYQNAQVLKQKLNLLKTAMNEVEQFSFDQSLILHSAGTSEGINPASHIVKANKLLLEYFGGNQNAVDMILDGATGDKNSKVVQAIKDIYNKTQKMNETILDGKTFEEVQQEYKSQYKEIYNTDFIAEELTEKTMEAKATGGMVKLAAITIISYLITRSSIISEINAAVAGGVETGSAIANATSKLVPILMRQGLAKEQAVNLVQQGIRFAMTSTTVAEDATLTLFNQLTSERGYNEEEFTASTKSAAKYIYFSAYIGSQVANAVGNAVSEFGLARGLMRGGNISTKGALKTTTLNGEKVFENILKTGKSVGQKLAVNSAKFGTDVGMFSALGIATDGQEVGEAFAEQSTFLPKLKIMNHVLEYALGRMMGSKAGVQAPLISRPKDLRMEEAIKRSGLEDLEIIESKSPNGTRYSVKNKTLGTTETYRDMNQLTTSLLERVAKAYEEVKIETLKEDVKTDNVDNRTISTQGIWSKDKEYIIDLTNDDGSINLSLSFDKNKVLEELTNYKFEIERIKQEYGINEPLELKLQNPKKVGQTFGDDVHDRITDVRHKISFKFNTQTGKLISIITPDKTYNIENNTVTSTTMTKELRMEMPPNATKEQIPLNSTPTYIETYVSKDGRQISHEEFIEGNVTGEFEIYDIDPNGKKFKIGIAELMPNGGKYVEKTLTSLDGTKTDYIYKDDASGNKFLYYKITDSEGNILFKTTKKHKVISENHFQTTTNNQSYDIEFTNEKVIVYKLDKQGNKTSEFVEYKIEDVSSEDYQQFDNELNGRMFSDFIMGNKSKEEVISGFIADLNINNTVDKKLVPMLKQLSGEEWFKLNNSGTKLIIGAEDNNFSGSIGGIIKIADEHTNVLAVFEHEAGHEAFNHLNLADDSNLHEIYGKEKEAYTSTFPDDNSLSIAYFLINGNRGISETTAETNLLTNITQQDNSLQARTVLLQHYFPKTLAYIANKLTMEVAKPKSESSNNKIDTKTQLVSNINKPLDIDDEIEMFDGGVINNRNIIVNSKYLIDKYSKTFPNEYEDRIDIAINNLICCNNLEDYEPKIRSSIAKLMNYKLELYQKGLDYENLNVEDIIYSLMGIEDNIHNINNICDVISSLVDYKTSSGKLNEFIEFLHNNKSNPHLKNFINRFRVIKDVIPTFTGLADINEKQGLNIYARPLSICLMELYGNIDEKYIPFLINNPEFTNRFAYWGIIFTDNKIMDVLINQYKKNSVLDDNIISALNMYKETEKMQDLTPELAENLHKFMQTQETQINMIVYRGDGDGFAKGVEISGTGKTLYDILLEHENDTQDQLDYLVADKLSGQKITNKNFISTSFNTEIANYFASQSNDIKIVWELNIPKGTHGCVIDLLSDVYPYESEFLLQNESKYVIQKIENNNGIWYIKANIIQE